MDEAAVRELYKQIIDGWNGHSGEGFAAPFAEDGEMIGFDGSRTAGRERIASELGRIFADHETAPYIVQVREVRAVGDGAAVLQAAVGMVPPGKSEIEPSRNAWQTLVAERHGGDWKVVLFQTTPAQYHGRPEEVERMTRELTAVLKAA